MQIIELLTPAYEVAWLPWAVQYFFLVGVATGAALLVSACAWGADGSARQRLLPAAVLALAVSAVSAPVSLLADLHQPLRFWHFYAHFTPWSWMSLGALLLPVFVGLSLAMCASWWLGRSRWMRWLAPLLVVSALSIAVYTGAELMVVRARPLWNTLWVPLNLALTGWLATVGVVLVRPGFSLGMGLAMLAAAWVFRWALFMGVQGVPKFGAGLYVYRMPLGGDGLLGMLGVVGLCVALVTAITWALEYFPARHHAAA